MSKTLNDHDHHQHQHNNNSNNNNINLHHYHHHHNHHQHYQQNHSHNNHNHLNNDDNMRRVDDEDMGGGSKNQTSSNDTPTLPKTIVNGLLSNQNNGVEEEAKDEENIVVVVDNNESITNISIINDEFSLNIDDDEVDYGEQPQVVTAASPQVPKTILTASTANQRHSNGMDAHTNSTTPTLETKSNLIKYQHLSTKKGKKNGSLTNGHHAHHPNHLHHHNHHQHDHQSDYHHEEDDNDEVDQEEEIEDVVLLEQQNGGGQQKFVLDETDHAMATSKSSSLVTSIIDDELLLNADEIRCLLCNSSFDFSRHKRLVCKVCALNVCFECSLYDDDSWICIDCHQQRTICSEFKCQSWLCRKLLKNPKERELLHLVNARIRFVASNRHHNNHNNHNNHHYHQQKSNNNNGQQQQHMNDSIKHNSNNNNNHISVANDQENGQKSNGHHNNNDDDLHPDDSMDETNHQNNNEEEDEDELLQSILDVCQPIETILKKWLGIESINHSHIGYLFEDDQYNQLLETYMPVLAHLIMIVQQASIPLSSSSSKYLTNVQRQQKNKSTGGCDENNENIVLANNPQDAYLKLRQSLHEISEKSFQTFTTIQLRPRTQLKFDDLEKFIDECQSYEHLLANSIVNQIIEDGQSRFQPNPYGSLKRVHSTSLIGIDSHNNNNHHHYSQHHHPHHHNHSQQHHNNHHHHHQNTNFSSNNNSHNNNRIRSSCSGGSLYAASNESSATSDCINSTGHHHHHNHKMMDQADYNSFDDAASGVGGGCCDRPGCSPLHHHAQGEDHQKDTIAADDDEALHAYDDEYDVQFADDQCNDIDHYEDDQQEDNEDDDDFKFELNFEQSKVYFPEAGLDLIDSKKFSSIESNLSQDSGIKLIDNTQSWQENWYFKKNKDNKCYHNYHLNSDLHFGYMALALSEPVPMLIPNPSQQINPKLGELEVDQVSDISEHNSETGSIIFSSDEEKDEDSGTKIDQIAASSAALIQNAVSDVAKSKSNTVYIENRRQRQSTSGISSIKQSSSSELQCRKNRAIFHSLRWTKIKVPDFVPSELRTICSSIPNPHVEDLDYIPNFILKPGNASIHSGILAQFCCKAKGLMPLYFAWYKDGQLIAASDDQRTPEEIETNRLARTYFGLRFTHRRYVESSFSSYRLIVFNDNECILELKKSSPSHGGVYTVVAYNHAGHDWCDFKLIVDRSHYSVNLNPVCQFNGQATQPMSPRPVLRRPQRKTRKTPTNITTTRNTNDNNSKNITNHTNISQLVAKIESPIIETLRRSSQIAATITNNRKQQPPHVIQRTWHEREASESNNNSRNRLLMKIKHRSNTLPERSTPELVRLDSIDNNNTATIGDGSLNSIESKQNPKIIACTDIVHQRTYDENGSILDEYDETIHVMNVNDNDRYQNATNVEQEQPQQSLSLSDNVSSSLNDSINIPAMPIAEREHRKWNNPEVNLPNNPYSPENIEKRVRSRLYSPNSEILFYATSGSDVTGDMASLASVVEQTTENIEEEDIPEEKKKFFHSSRDLERYKRDYYLPSTNKSNNTDGSFSILNTLGGKPLMTKNSTAKKPNNNNSNNRPRNNSCSDITMVNSGQAPSSSNNNNNDNHHHHDDGSSNDNSENHNDDGNISSTPLTKSEYRSEICVHVVPTTSDVIMSSSINNGDGSIDDDGILVGGDDHHKLRTLSREQEKPPIGQNKVKNLTSLFSSTNTTTQSNQSLEKSNSLSPIPQQQQQQKTEVKSKSQSGLNVPNANYAVYSLTGRTIPKEFREKNQKNMPRFHEPNRISLANEMLSSANSNNHQQQESATTTLIIEQKIDVDNSHSESSSDQNSLQSMESNGSSSISPALPNGNHQSTRKEGTGAIKKRANFWQKRIESSQISDHQVQDAFPAMDGSDGATQNSNK